MTDEATREGASQVEGQEAQASEAQDQQPENLSPREAKMKQVAEAAREKREADRKAMALVNNPDLTEEEYDAQQVAASGSDEDGSDPSDSGPASDEERDAEHAGADTAGEEQPEGGDEPRAAEPPTTGWYERDDGTRVKRLKINGEFRELTEEEYDRAVSKEFAGDQKLRLAAERQRQLDERERQIQEQLQKAQQQPREMPSGPSEEEFAEKMQKYHDALYAGETDTAVEIMKELYAGRQTPTPNIEQLVSQAVTTTLTEREAQQEQERRNASARDGWSEFVTAYPEIAENDRKLAYADAILKEVRADNPDWEPRKVILEAGRLAAEELGVSKEDVKDDAPKPSSQTVDRITRKTKLKSVPGTAASSKAKDEKPQVDMSPSAKIARLRQARAV